MIPASYDSNGSVPTTDISFETQATQESMYPQRNHPVPHSQAPRKPVDDPFISPASHQVGTYLHFRLTLKQCISSVQNHK